MGATCARSRSRGDLPYPTLPYPTLPYPTCMCSEQREGANGTCKLTNHRSGFNDVCIWNPWEENCKKMVCLSVLLSLSLISFLLVFSFLSFRSISLLFFSFLFRARSALACLIVTHCSLASSLQADLHDYKTFLCVEPIQIDPAVVVRAGESWTGSVDHKVEYCPK